MDAVRRLATVIHSPCCRHSHGEPAMGHRLHRMNTTHRKRQPNRMGGLCLLRSLPAARMKGLALEVKGKGIKGKG